MNAIVTLAALTSKKKTLEERIVRYTEYLEADDKLLAESNHPEKYTSRRRNHADKLERYKNSLQAIENTILQLLVPEEDKNATITLELISSKRGELELLCTFPDGTTEPMHAELFYGLYHITLHTLPIKAEAWLRCANFLHFSQSVAAKLRKGKKHTVTFSDLHLQTIHKQVHTDRNGMHTHPNTPKLQNI